MYIFILKRSQNVSLLSERMSAKRAREDENAAPVAPSPTVDVQSALEWKIERLVLNNFKLRLLVYKSVFFLLLLLLLA